MSTRKFSSIIRLVQTGPTDARSTSGLAKEVRKDPSLPN